MIENMKKIVELSDCKWIQDRWKVKEGDLYFFRINKRVFVIHGKPDMNKDCCIWLPVGFNPETGNWQIDDLLMEILRYNLFELSCWISEKMQKLKWGSYKDMNMLYLGMPTIKLIWLRELIEKEVR